MSGPPSSEAERQEAFERDKVCYEQNFEQFRAMNQIMWQVPLLAMTITGGLWYAALTVPEAQEMRRPLMLLSAIFDFALVAVLWRVRYVMGEYSSKHSSLVVKLPFKEAGVDKAGVLEILDSAGLGLPKYYASLPPRRTNTSRQW